MNIHQITNAYFEEPRFDKNILMGISHAEMKFAVEDIDRAAEDLNRLGFKDFAYTGCSLTPPLREVQRSIFPAKTRSANPNDERKSRRQLKLDRNLTFMIDLTFEYCGERLAIANTRIPYVQPGGKIEMMGKTYFARSVLVDRGVNVANGGLFIPLNRTGSTMTRDTHSFIMDNNLMMDNVLIGNLHRGRDNKKGRGDDKITATQNIFLYLLAKYGWKEATKMMGTDLEIVEGESYDEVFQEYYPKGYTVFGTSGIKTSGGKKADWYPPKLYLLYKGELALTSEEYRVVGLVVANFYYIADRIPNYLQADLMNDSEFWTNILGRFIFYSAGKPGHWYTEEGQNHLTKSVDTLLDLKAQRQLLEDGIDVGDMYELIAWVILHEKELYAHVHPSDISRKRITTMRYLLSYIINRINLLGYKLLGRTGSDGKFEVAMNKRKLDTIIREQIKEGIIRELTHESHGEVETIESPSASMYITNTRQMLDQTKVKGSTKERNHMYNQGNVLHPSKATRARIDGIDKSTPSGSTQINPYLDMSQNTGMDIPPYLQRIEDKLKEDLREEF